MPGAGITLFVIFFGISLLEALRGGHWIRAAFWLAIGAAFYALDRVRRDKTLGTKPPTGAP